MKNSILKILKLFIDFLSIQHTKLLTKTEINLPYNSLSPTDNAEKVDDYLNALEWALNKRDKIKNIAIAGPYGAGKSSIINTFRNRCKSNNDYKFLPISLATFKEEKNSETTIPETKDDLLRLIELSILQQLFYHEKDTKIPDSRFKKIKIQKNSYSLLITIGLLIFTTSFLHIVFPDFLAKFYLKELPAQNSFFFHYLSVLIIAFGILLIVYSSIRTLKRLSVKKLGINNASIEIDDKISKSILNNHIDEILYFFEVTKYNIVIIEDLDRFEQTDVFTKLREINLLINNSKKIENDVVFIYAIRDDMFQDKDRTKFFDFMIPVIPVINSSNSNDKLLKLIELNKYKISESLVDDISLFIDDMRLLYNIMNEYHVYFKKLNESLSQDKLLAMIVYKNIYPNDFTKLSQNKGELYSTITNRYQYIIEKTSEINNQIIELKNEIEKLENAELNSTKELRMIYLYKIIEKISQENPSYPFHSFRVGHSSRANALKFEGIFSILVRQCTSVHSTINADFRFVTICFE
ncbi:MAG: P-loop NTPase fold protein [Haliscomenobacter sp.]|uniref:YobI family P-loop NTPase n=1 Tax=Haliscomenobacter sp. TaxID=2717303 RepID=UPI0029A6D643|nr:P-loop NTPase fold protein [Haliscomenobacter sp.]MDX2069430.1 P-loop NTPase fold protein [Haliscomenobacter sp.]